MRLLNFTHTKVVLLCLGLCFFGKAYGQVDVTLEKTTITAASVKYNTDIPFTLTVTNNGSSPIQNVIVRDIINDGFTFSSGSNSGWGLDPVISNAVRQTIPGPIAPGASESIAIILQVRPSDNSGDWDNTAEIVSFEEGGNVLTTDINPSDNTSRVQVPVFDMALTKELVTPGPYAYGDTLTFSITVYNQGNIVPAEVDVTDYIPEGYTNVLATNTPNGWSNTLVNPVFTFTNVPLGGQQTTTIDLELGADMFNGQAWDNYAEILESRDGTGTIIAIDADSDPGLNTDEERTVQPGDDDDNYRGNNPVNPNFEDDHDPAGPIIYDVALIKERISRPLAYSYSQPIEFELIVFNQGGEPLQDIIVRDSLPCGIADLDLTNNPGWTYNPTTRIAEFVIPGPLLPAQSDTFLVELVAQECYIDPATAWTNYAEVFEARNAAGQVVDDIDSEFDNSFSNDAGGEPETLSDNFTMGHGIFDEDDHDVEAIQVVDMALRKTTVTTGPFAEGDTIVFDIEVFNQGNVIAMETYVEDLVPEGFRFDLASNTSLGWVFPIDVAGNTFNKITNVNTTPLMPGDSTNVQIKLILELDGKEPRDWYNYAHMFFVVDSTGDIRSNDADSSPIFETEEERSVIPGDSNDDNIFTGGVGENEDQDDHDPATMNFYDLALEKSVSPGPYAYETPVQFTIDVINQGNERARNIQITDYIPCGYRFDQTTSAANGLWSEDPVSGYLVYNNTLDTLFPGETLSVTLDLILQECSDADAWKNEAEISFSGDVSGDPIVDQDSTPDNDPSNDDPNNDGVNEEDDIDDATPDIFDLSLEKSFAILPASTAVGTTLTYTITVTNEGNVPATNVEVTDYLPCGLDFAPNNGWTVSGSNIVNTIASTINPGSSVDLTLELTIGSCPDGEAANYTNKAEISDDGPEDDIDSTPDNDPDNDPEGEDDIDEQPFDVFDLMLEKNLVTAGPYSYGQTLTYEIVVTNQGTIPAERYVVSDYLPCGLEFAPNNGFIQVGSNAELEVTNVLNPGESRTHTIELTLVECANPTSTSWYNAAEISENDGPEGPIDDQDSTPDRNPGNDPEEEDDQDVAPLDILDLSLNKSFAILPTSTAVGTTLTYTITVTNEGNVPATNVEVTDYLPCGLDFAANNGWTASGSNIVNTIASTINPGSSVDLTLELTIGTCPDGEAANYTNKAEISDDGPEDDIDSTPDDNPDNDPEGEDDIDEQPFDVFDLMLEKNLVTAGPYSYSQTLTYEIVVTNQGTIPAERYVVSDYLPCGLDFVANNGFVQVGSNAELEVTDVLNPGESRTHTIELTLVECANPTSTSWYNAAEISENDGPEGPIDDQDSTPDRNPGNDPEAEDDHDVAPLDILDLSLNKSFAILPASTAVGTTLTYTITVTNEGNVPVTDVEVTDYIPCGLDFTANNGWTASGSNIVNTIASTINPGASIDLTLELTIGMCPDGEAANYTNKAEISDDGPEDDIDSTPDNNPDNDPEGEDDIDEQPFDVFDLMLEKNLVTAGPYSYGQTLTYEIVVTNQGTIPAERYVVSDYLPCGLDFAPNNGFVQVGSNAELEVTDVLNPGESRTHTIELTLVECANPTSTSWYNAAEISENDGPEGPIDDQDSTPDRNPGNDPEEEDDHDVAPLDILDLSLNKSFAILPTSTAVGTTLTYTITVTNEGNVPATNVEVTDYLPCGLDFAPNNGWTVSGSNIVNTIASTINPGASVDLTLELTIGMCPDGEAANYTNKAEISDDGPEDDIDSTPDNNPDNDPEGEDDIDEQPFDVFDLMLEKNLVTAGPYSYGQTLTYEIVVTNQGTIPAERYVVSDYLPCGLDFAPNNGFVQVGSNAELEVTDVLNPGESRTHTIELTLVECANPTSTSWYNAAEISENDGPEGPIDDQDSTPDRNPGNDPEEEDDHDVAPLDILDLSLNKSFATLPPSTAVGTTLTYTITVTNEGNVPATNVEVTDYLPCGLDFAANNGWTASGSNIVNTIASTINPGASVDLTLELTIGMCPEGELANYTNRAEISDDGPEDDIDSTPDNNPDNDPEGEDDIDEQPFDVFDLMLEKNLVTAGPYSYGQTLTYEIVVTNQGTIPAERYVVSDYLPCGLDFVANNGFVQVGNNAELEVTDVLNPGESRTHTIELTLVECANPTSTSWYNAAEISENDGPEGPIDDQDSTPDRNPGNDPEEEDDHDVAPLDILDLSLNKSFATLPPSTAVGTTLTYTITVTNEGNVPVTGVEVTDYLPCGLDFTANNGWTASGSNIVNTIASTINPGSSVDLTLELTIGSCPDGEAANYTNKAEISDDGPEDDIDSTPDNNPDNDPEGEDDIDEQPFDVFDLMLEKNLVTAGPYSYGQTLTYEIEVTNQGTIPAERYVVSDYLPCGLDFAPNNGFVQVGDNAELEVTDVLNPGESRTHTIELTLVECANPTSTSWYNAAEISENDGPEGPIDDQDSTPDRNPGNDPEAEDDHDVAPLDILDLSLTKTIASNASVYEIDDVIEYAITVTNEGNVTSTSTTVEDRLPCTLVFLPSPGWTDNGDGTAEYTIAASLEPGQSTTITLYARVQDCEVEDFVNVAEIIDFDVPPGGPTDDIDSTPDNNDPDEDDQDDVSAPIEIQCIEIRGYAWYDVIEDDIRQSFENGINGLRVNLYRLVGSTYELVETQKTHHDEETPSDDGLWEFCVPAGTYYVEVKIPPVGLVLARPNIGSDKFDSDITGANGVNTTNSFTISRNNPIDDLGAGYYPMATVGTEVWYDENSNGLQEEEESRAANVTVEIYNEDREKVKTTTTDAAGQYLLDYMQREKYYLKFVAPAGYSFTDHVYGQHDRNSDVTHANGLNTTNMMQLSSGMRLENIDAGLAFGVLPVTWVDVTASVEYQYNLIEWKTADEVNNSHFEVEKSYDGSSFEYIGTVHTAFIEGITSYDFDDKDVSGGVVYYRIKQVDLDGQYTYSKVVSVRREDTVGQLAVSPNPASNYITISGIDAEKYNSISIFDAQGKYVRRLDWSTSANSSIRAEVSDLSNGVYTLKFNGRNGEQEVMKFIKL